MATDTPTTTYQDELDVERLAALTSYQVAPSSLDLHNVKRNVNINVFIAYGPDFSNKLPNTISSEAPHRYHDLLVGLMQNPNIRFTTHHEVCGTEPVGTEVMTVVRHDVDGDLVAALQQAEIEHSLGIATTYYLLHTAPYYGMFDGDVFERNEESAEIYRQIQAFGHEIALHTDGLTLFHDRQINGAQAIEQELAWLRSQGLEISGHTAHNSFGVYGADNYAIFKGRPFGPGNRPAGPKGVIHKGKWAPLQLLDETEMGLQHEANEVFWQKKYTVEYAALRDQNYWRQATTDRSGEKVAHSELWLSQEELIDHYKGLTGPGYAVLAVHPIFYGLRSAQEEGPLAHDLSETDVASILTEPGIHARISHDPEIATTHSLFQLNEEGAADKTRNVYDAGEYQMVTLCGEQLDSTRIPVDSKAQNMLVKHAFFAKDRKRIGNYSYSLGTTSSAKIAKKLKKLLRESTPSLVCIESDALDRAAAADITSALTELDRSVAQVVVIGDTEPTIECDHWIKPSDEFAAYRGGATLRFATGEWAFEGHNIISRALFRIVKADV